MCTAFIAIYDIDYLQFYTNYTQNPLLDRLIIRFGCVLICYYGIAIRFIVWCIHHWELNVYSHSNLH